MRVNSYEVDEATQTMADDAVPETIRRALTHAELGTHLAEQLTELEERLQSEAKAHEADPYAFFYDWMPAERAHPARRVVAMNDEVLIGGLENAFDDDLVEQSVRSVQAVRYLMPAHRERLTAGLRALQAPGEHWTEACDRLLLGLDGALWAAAEAQGLVAPGGQHLLAHPTHRFVSGHAGLLDPEHGLTLSPSLRRFLHFGLFADDRAVRDGRAETGYRRYSLLAASGVTGWLARYDQRGPYLELISRLGAWFDRFFERLAQSRCLAGQTRTSRT